MILYCDCVKLLTTAKTDRHSLIWYNRFFDNMIWGTLDILISWTFLTVPSARAWRENACRIHEQSELDSCQPQGSHWTISFSRFQWPTLLANSACLYISSVLSSFRSEKSKLNICNGSWHKLVQVINFHLFIFISISLRPKRNPRSPQTTPN